MSDAGVGPAGLQDVRAVGQRRDADERAFRLAAAFAAEGMAWCARDEGAAIGLALAHDAENERCVAGLYVEPSFRGGGIGGRLLDAALDEAGDRTRAAMLEAGDAAAVALVLRRGMAVRVPVLRMAGEIPREETLAAMAAGEYRFEIEPVDPARHGAWLDALDRETRGTARAGDHARFAESASGSAVFRNEEFVGYSYVWPDGRIGPIAAASAAYLVQLLALSMVTLERRYGAAWCSAFVPAANVRLARAALRAGLRIEGANLFASDAPEGDLCRYAGFHPLLF